MYYLLFNTEVDRIGATSMEGESLERLLERNFPLDELDSVWVYGSAAFPQLSEAEQESAALGNADNHAAGPMTTGNCYHDSTGISRTSATCTSGAGTNSGSEVESASRKQLDFLFITKQNAEAFHAQNLAQNWHHYNWLRRLPLRLLGYVNRLGPGLYFNAYCALQVQNRICSYAPPREPERAEPEANDDSSVADLMTKSSSPDAEQHATEHTTGPDPYQHSVAEVDDKKKQEGYGEQSATGGSSSSDVVSKQMSVKLQMHERKMQIQALSWKARPEPTRLLRDFLQYAKTAVPTASAGTKWNMGDQRSSVASQLVSAALGDEECYPTGTSTKSGLRSFRLEDDTLGLCFADTLAARSTTDAGEAETQKKHMRGGRDAIDPDKLLLQKNIKHAEPRERDLRLPQEKILTLPTLTQEVKYGIVERSALLEDLRTWQHLYCAGRAQKPMLRFYFCEKRLEETDRQWIFFKRVLEAESILMETRLGALQFARMKLLFDARQQEEKKADFSAGKTLALSWSTHLVSVRDKLQDVVASVQHFRSPGSRKEMNTSKEAPNSCKGGKGGGTVCDQTEFERSRLFPEDMLWHHVCDLSYRGDVRRLLFENPRKTEEIIRGQRSFLERIYRPLFPLGRIESVPRAELAQKMASDGLHAETIEKLLQGRFFRTPSESLGDLATFALERALSEGETRHISADKVLQMRVQKSSLAMAAKGILTNKWSHSVRYAYRKFLKRVQKKISSFDVLHEEAKHLLLRIRV
ncbi:unnamed protein product, partial [Amoebophrya sp. A120]|eukprot:GSA120T00015412001.1